ncbi:MAG: hypothetical protein HOI23_05840 [Deltaproteobacteria bacterium]|jgi:hypothetical protein|nr:hypothetical protein [Deltaproteobacteria bacterium]MBT6436349.1 hypothetical protein [Deltaproteobacteria bacterium]
MSKHPLHDAILEQLQDTEPTGPAGQLVDLAYDHLVALKVGELVDFDAVADDILDVMAGDGPGILLDRHAETFLEFERARVTETGETLGDAVPQVIVDGIEERMNRRMTLPKGFGRDIVDPAFIRNLVTGSLTETLENFLTKLPIIGGNDDKSSGSSSGSGGLFGSIARKGAKRLQDAGSALSGIGAGLQETLKGQARDFAAQSADRLKQGIVDGFNSKDSRGALKAMRKRALDAVLNLKQSDIHVMLDDPNLETQILWAKEFLKHNLARPEIRAALKEQIVAGLKRDEDRTIADILKDAGLDKIAQERVRAHFLPQVGQLASSSAFGDWLNNVLTQAASR